MITKKLFLYFPESKIEKPIISHLVRDYDLTLNIFRAKVTPEEVGFLVIEVTGEEANVAKGIEYLQSLQIEVNETSRGLRWEESRCVHCGNCIPHCPTDALKIVDRTTMRVSFEDDACIQCLSCIDNCPYGAVTSLF